MKTLIIAPQFVTKVGDYYHFPLGLAYISAVLKRAGFDVATLNLNYVPQEECAQTIQNAIKTGKIDVVCCGGLSAHYHNIKDVVRAARGGVRKVKVVLGGGIISSEPELMLKALDADIAVIGEGEVTSQELFKVLAEGGQLANVLGIIYRDATGAIVQNEARPYIENLDAWPMPDYEGFNADRYLDMQQTGDFFHLNKYDKPKLLPIILSRSCPYSCTFCYHPLGSKYRRRSLDSFFAELDHLVGTYAINILAIVDELFSLDKVRMAEFCARMKRYNILWAAQLRVDRVDRETLAMLKDSGLFFISYGIESASNTVLKSMRKQTRIEQVDKALAITRELGIGIQGNLIMGDPAETEETAAETLAWWKRNTRYHINMVPIIPYPGSEVYKQSVERGIIPDRLKFIEDGCPSLNMTALDQARYGLIFENMRQAQNEHKQFSRDVVVTPSRFDPVKNIPLYRLEMTCPHCDTRNVYNDFHHSSLELFKLVCRNCHQRSDISAAHLPAFRETWAPLLDVLEDLADKRTAISVTPVINDNLFKEVLFALGFDWRRLNFRYALDVNRNKEGGEFMGMPILHRNQGNLRGICGADHIFVLPCGGVRTILRELHQSGVDFSRVTYIGSKFGLPGLMRPYTQQDLLREVDDMSSSTSETHRSTV